MDLNRWYNYALERFSRYRLCEHRVPYIFMSTTTRFPTIIIWTTIYTESSTIAYIAYSMCDVPPVTLFANVFLWDISTSLTVHNALCTLWTYFFMPPVYNMYFIYDFAGPVNSQYIGFKTGTHITYVVVKSTYLIM